MMFASATFSARAPTSARSAGSSWSYRWSRRGSVKKSASSRWPSLSGEAPTRPATKERSLSRFREACGPRRLTSKSLVNLPWLPVRLTAAVPASSTPPSSVRTKASMSPIMPSRQPMMVLPAADSLPSARLSALQPPFMSSTRLGPRRSTASEASVSPVAGFAWIFCGEAAGAPRELRRAQLEQVLGHREECLEACRDRRLLAHDGQQVRCRAAASGSRLLRTQLRHRPLHERSVGSLAGQGGEVPGHRLAGLATGRERSPVHRTGHRPPERLDRARDVQEHHDRGERGLEGRHVSLTRGQELGP